MERLTQRLDYNYEYEYGSIGIACDDEQYLEKVYNKLGQLEDIEEELGIDLITLFKAISNEKGIWKKVYGTKDFVNTRAMLTCEFGKWRIYDKEWIYELKDYGKTWWLEKPKENNDD